MSSLFDKYNTFYQETHIFFKRFTLHLYQWLLFFRSDTKGVLTKETT